MIKVDLIAGFLGAGKTTFLLKYARHLMAEGERIGILVYDYGAVNVDMLLLNKLRCSKCEIEMVAAACDEDCLRRRFSTKLIAMAMSGYTRVIIEPSGIFDMDMFFDALRDDPLEKWYEIGSVITIVNAKLRDDLSVDEDFVLASHVANAGCVVLSRTQLATTNEIMSTKEHILRATQAINCKKYTDNFLEKNWEELDKEDYVNLMDAGYRLGSYVKLSAGREMDFSSKCYLDLPLSLEELKERIIRLFKTEEFGKIIRVKGFVIDEGGSIQINASEYEILTEPVSIGQGVLIVIGYDLNEDNLDKLFGV